MGTKNERIRFWDSEIWRVKINIDLTFYHGNDNVQSVCGTRANRTTTGGSGERHVWEQLLWMYSDWMRVGK